MPCKYMVSNDGLLVVEYWQGAITHDEGLNHEYELFLDTRIKSGASTLSDLRHATFPETNTKNVGELAAPYGETKKPHAIRRIALVARPDEQFNKARAYEREVRSLGANAIVFSSFETACTWLGANAQEMQHIIQQLAEEI